jgi:hypothetical protein
MTADHDTHAERPTGVRFQQVTIGGRDRNVRAAIAARNTTIFPQGCQLEAPRGMEMNASETR